MFHLPHRETTMTLEDVLVLLGLPIDGRKLVWVIPLENIVKRNTIRLFSLNNNFQQLPVMHSKMLSLNMHKCISYPH